MKAFRPLEKGLEQRLYDFVYTSLFYAVKSFSRDEDAAAASGYKIAYIIKQAAEDAVDDVIRNKWRRDKDAK